MCLFPGYLIFHVGIGTSVVNSRMEKVVWGLPEKNEKEISFNNSKLECHFRQNFDPIGATRIIRIIFFSNNNKTQCARTDLNKRFLPKQMTTTG